MALFEKNEMHEFFIQESKKFANDILTKPIQTSVGIARTTISFSARHPVEICLIGPYLTIASAMLFANVVANIVGREDFFDL